jgi:hypothetical protein
VSFDVHRETLQAAGSCQTAARLLGMVFHIQRPCLNLDERALRSRN